MLKVSFEFDEESKAVTNVKVVKVPSKYDNIDLPIVEVGDNKLIISPKAVSLLSAQCGDRIAVNYIPKNKLTIPVIGKAEVFSDPENGNKLTKSNTVSFKGTQKTILSKYGQLFKIEEYKGGMFKMTKIDESDLSKIDPDLDTESSDLSKI